MNDNERQQLLVGLEKSEARLLALVAALSAQQWAFREQPNSRPDSGPDTKSGRWSIAEIIEHLAIFERFIVSAILGAMAHPVDRRRRDAAAEFSLRNEGLVLGLAESRATRQFKTREVTTPVGRWTDPAKLTAEFREARAETIAIVTEMRGNPRDFFFAHVAFGDMDCYQWLLLLGTHTERHVLQMEEVMRDGAFPN